MSLDTAIEKAEQKIEYLSSDEEAMRIYYERERSLHERANMINSAEARGIEQGKKEEKKNIPSEILSVVKCLYSDWDYFFYILSNLSF